MSTLTRRTFVQLSAGTLLTAASNKLFANTQMASVTKGDGLVSVKGANYAWDYRQATDTFRLHDSKNRLIVSGKLQAAVVVAPAGQPTLRICTPGKAIEPHVEPGRVTFAYEGVNGDARLQSAWRFDEQAIWMEPLVYETPDAQEVVSLHYFSDIHSTETSPALHASYLVVPGINEGSTVSPVVRDMIGLNQSVWLGRGSSSAGWIQQWGLPVHYFCGFSVGESAALRNALTEGRSDAFACGLADLPGGDLYLQLSEGKGSPWIDYRSDLWKHLSGPGRLQLGATFLWCVGADYYKAIAGYYQGLLQAGIIHKKHNSPRKTAISLTPQFCTWGAQVDQGKTGENLTEKFLTDIYAELKSSGMKAGLFSIDDKWEGTYGNLEHSATRLPHFEEFLGQLRADGLKIGMWAALMRCERPSDLGLTLDHMLKKPDGKPYLGNEFGYSGPNRYYILDLTQPEVAKVLSDTVRKFIRRYKPDVFKFDFGYELPAMGVAAPLDKQWAGERLMAKGLDVVIRAMREENPDQVVMYYNLSPLFLDYFDLHSPDDLFVDVGDYDVEANRRFFFSSLLGPLGVPTYGSSGYDWASAPSIWFDSAALGTIGSLNDFKSDEQGEACTQELAAKYNGIVKVLRSTGTFEILPLESVSESPTLGAHARSWARFEDGQLVLLAWRPPVRGEENPLLQLKSVDPRIENAVHSSVPVVVASKTQESIVRSDELAIVAYGGGEIVLRREQGKQAAITSHYFGETVAHGEAAIAEGYLKVTVEERNAAGKPLEWIEVRIS
jgi:hypothetical protein